MPRRLFPRLRSTLAPSLAAIALLLPPSPAHAATLDLSQYGWEVTSAENQNITFTLNPARSSSSVLSLDVVTDYRESPIAGAFPSISLVFFQRTRPATPLIEINSYSVTNSTNSIWSGLNLSLGAPHDTNAVSFDRNATHFARNPFPQQRFFIDFPDRASGLYAFGGTLSPAQTAQLGSLTINAGPFNSGPSYLYQTFALFQSPILQSEPPPALIPLPPAAATILIGLGPIALTLARRTALSHRSR